MHFGDLEIPNSFLSLYYRYSSSQIPYIQYTLYPVKIYVNLYRALVSILNSHGFFKGHHHLEITERSTKLLT